MPPFVGVAVNVTLVPVQIEVLGVAITTLGTGEAFTVTVAVCVQPALVLYVIILVPAATPVTTPVLLIVATLVVAEDHGVVASGVPEPVKVVVNPAQTVSVPVIVGVPLTVTVAVFVQPELVL